MNAPAISVVIPVYNGENYLAATIDSALHQTYPIAEILVIDDGSTDATAQITASFGDAIRVHRTANQGVSAARNLGLSEATTEWVALLDHDDVWEPNHIECVVSSILRRPEADVIYGSARRLVLNSRGDKFVVADVLPFPDESRVATQLLERCPIQTSAIAVRRSRVLALGGFDSHFSNAQDWDMWVRLALDGAIFASSPETTTRYRIHTASRTHNALRALGFYVDVLEMDILPRMPAWKRVPHRLRITSRLEGEAAILLRELNQPGALRMMIRSIVKWPLQWPQRYLVLANMLLRAPARYTKRAASTV